MNAPALSLGAALPELFLALSALGLLLYGAIAGEGAYRRVAGLSIAALAAAAALLFSGAGPRSVGFSGLFVTDGFATFMKALVLLGAGLGLVLSLDHNRREDMERFEFPILVLFATIGMMLLISASYLM